MKIKYPYILFVVVLNILGVLSHKTPAYYHGRLIQRDQGAWMGNLSDSMLLRDISIPGTHETMARFGGPIPECQTMDLDTQLKSGIRVLDIRCRCVNNKFQIHHDIVYQFRSYDDVLNSCKSYLNANPSETILMRVKEEYQSKNCTGDFASQFLNAYWNNQDYSDYFWNPTTFNPKLSEVRKKIIVLNNFEIGQRVGLPYPQFADIQDNYQISSNWALYDKWIAIKDQLNKTNSVENRNNFYMNYLSGSGGSFPYFVASGHIGPGTSSPRLWTGLLNVPKNKNKYPDFPRIAGGIYFEGTNMLTYQSIQQNQQCFIGIIMADYPGEGLIDEIILRNTRCSELSEGDDILY